MPDPPPVPSLGSLRARLWNLVTGLHVAVYRRTGGRIGGLTAGARRREVLARSASAQEKERLWPRVVDLYSGYAPYRRRTVRDVPLIVLAPATAG